MGERRKLLIILKSDISHVSNLVLFQRESTNLDERTIPDPLYGIIEGLRELKAILEERMDRMESKLDAHQSSAVLSASVDSLQSSLTARSDGTDAKVERLSTRLDARCDSMEKRLEKISYAVGIKYVVSAGDDDEDRKRLKMRLKEALKIQQYADSGGYVTESEREGYLEYIFGIREPNSRIGKQGSRHPNPTPPP